MLKTKIEQLFIYPIKSLKGVAVNQLNIGAFGVEDDRRYLLVNAAYKMLTQRSHAQLSQFELTLVDQGWQVTASNGHSIVIEHETCTSQAIQTSVWKTPLACFEKSKAVSQWFSQLLGEPVYLVEMDAKNPRVKTAKGIDAKLMFADGYPLLVCNQQSLNDVSTVLNRSLEMARFRANVVVSMPPQTEYDLAGFTHSGGGRIVFTKPCVRCNVPAINPATSVFDAKLHQQLNQELRRDKAVVFGMNAVVDNIHCLKLGDELVSV